MSGDEPNSNPDNAGPGSTASATSAHKSASKPNSPSFFTRLYNTIVAFIQSTFGYRKTTLSLLVIVTFILTIALSAIDNSLEWSVQLPSDKSEIRLLNDSWLDLQQLGIYQHPYGSQGNKFVHKYLQSRIKNLIGNKKYIEFDNDLNNTNRLLFEHSQRSVAYYESNNLLVRVNGTDPELPALLISAHYDSVPSSFGITDDGMGIASLLGVLNRYTRGKQPLRTLVFNFNNNEEFGLYGASAFLNHPWSANVKYFINLEGTGAGGKAILFRGTDYGITKEYSSVRYPYASSIFQQAFKSGLIHSETDYKIYFEDGGLRGIDIAFYKPRDIYHTGLDNIRNVNIKSLWHMLSSALDFVDHIAQSELEADADYQGDSYSSASNDASFITFFNYFFILPVSKVVSINIALLVVVPVVSLAFLIVIFGAKKNWRLGFVNTIKYPISLIISVFALAQINTTILATVNEYLPNAFPLLIVFTLFSIFLLLNYFILNGINLIFGKNKIVQHDEKLIVILQTSFIYWVLLIVSTAKQAARKNGGNRSGEALLSVLFAIQAVGAFLGILGWCLKPSKQELEASLGEAAQPLLTHRQRAGYGSADFEQGDNLAPLPDNEDSSFTSVDSYTARKKLSLIQRSFSYDWSLQFLILVPVSVLIIYNNGFLILSGINKSIQESLASEQLIYKVIEVFAIAWGLPFLPFIFKVNKFIVFLLMFFVFQGLVLISLKSPFDQENPMKLRFIQTADLTSSAVKSLVRVNGREDIFSQILSDMPSVKLSGDPIICDAIGDGMTACSYETKLWPLIHPNATDFSDYLQIQILKNSSFSDSPYGMLTAEIKITAPKSGMCAVRFDPAQTNDKSPSDYPKEFPVKTVIIYQDSHDTNSTKDLRPSSVPEGFSKDKNGDFFFKKIAGISSLDLNHLNTNETYHLGFQWVPNFIDAKASDPSTNLLHLTVECFWGDLGNDNDLVPAYKELVHFSPNYVSWANLNRGMVSVVDAFEI